MKKRFVAFLAIIMILYAFPLSLLAYDADKHDDYLEKVLLGSNAEAILKNKSAKEKMEMLEAASYLTIDQVQGKGETELKLLRKRKVSRVPKLSDIDLTGIFLGSHRNYTHRGWDYVYIIPKGEKRDKANWPVRKKLLCSTVNKVFDFGFMNELFGKVCDKGNSFSALVYYIHILGDHIYNEEYSVSDLTMPLARTNADDNNQDVFWELKKHCEVLFKDQKSSQKYISFMQELDALADKARELAGSKGGISDKNFGEYHQCAEDLMQLLEDYVPLMLAKEDFFENEFSAEKGK